MSFFDVEVLGRFQRWCWVLRLKKYGLVFARVSEDQIGYVLWNRLALQEIFVAGRITVLVQLSDSRGNWG